MRFFFSTYIKRIKFFPGKSFLLMVGLLPLLLAGCRDERLLDYDSLESDGETLRIKARIQPSVETRGDYYFGLDEVNPIVNGTFYLTYPKNENNLSPTYAPYGTAIVEFGKEDPEVGYAYYYRESDGAKKDLKWKNIAQEGTQSVYLYMHNINPDCITFPSDNSYSNQKYTFKTGLNPYVASPLDKEKGTNDLITSGGVNSNGSSVNYVTADANTGEVMFTLEHRMALLDVTLEAYSAENDSHVVSLENATVQITNLYTQLNSLNLHYVSDARFTTSSTGTYSCTYSQKKDVMLIDQNLGEDYTWEKTPEGNRYKEEDFVEEGITYKKHTYSVPEFVFPPQTLVDTSWPELIITVPKKDVTGSAGPEDQGFVTYRGFLPMMMYNTDPKLSPNPMETKLTSGYILHVTATINSPSTELTFSPVRVENWVKHGSYSFSTQKAGIYNKNDINKLIALYNNSELSDAEKAFELEQYGFFTDGLYVFEVWGNFSVDREEVAGSIIPNEKFPFMFLFSNYTLTVKSGSEDGDDGDSGDDSQSEDEILNGIEGEERFYEILTGQAPTPLFTGISSREDLLDFVSLCHSGPDYYEPSTRKLMKYGHLDSYDNAWTFEITEDIDGIDIDDLYQKINLYFLGNIYGMNMNGHSIRVNVNGNLMEISDEEGKNYFKSLADIKDNYGIYTPEDFYLLKEVYNNHYMQKPEFLSLFGTTSSTGDDPSKYSWKFEFRSTMTLNADLACSSMIIDTANGKPNYSFNYTSTAGITIYLQSEYFSFSFSKSWNYQERIFRGAGSVGSESAFKSLISYYNNPTNVNYQNLFSYGRYGDGKWIFPISYSSSSNSSSQLDYNDIFGKMVPELEAGLCDYDFDFRSYKITVKNMPVEEGSSETTTRYFSQEQNSDYNYPNSAADFKKLFLGTYWEPDSEEEELP